jgi:AcrR family transcriptional regulator
MNLPQNNMASTLKVKIRDKERTKVKILKAVGEVIEQYGTDKVGINLIARAAGVNKVLIYRYFGGVEGVMEQYVKTGEYTSTSSLEFIDNIEVNAPEQRGQVWSDILLAAMSDLRDRKATRDLLRWEIGAGKPVLANVRNEVALKMMERIGPLKNYPDTGALIAVLISAIYYITISADFRDEMMDVDLNSEDGWRRIEKVIRDLLAKID